MDKNLLKSEYEKFINSKDNELLLLYSSFLDLSIFLSKIVKESDGQTVIISDTISKVIQFLKIAEKYIDKKNIEIINKNLNKNEIFSAYKNISSQNIKLIVGTKTAIFSPFSNLKNIIILDEESVYHKQYDQNPRYDVKNIAGFIASSDKKIKLIYSSRCPSIETYSKKLKILNIKDTIKDNINTTFLGNSRDVITENLKNVIEESQKLNKKIVIINNNKSHSSSIMCNDCGYIEKCNKCNIPLKINKEANKETCNICNFSKDIIVSCPICNGTNIKFLGIGNQKIYQELKKLFPDKKIIIIDKETKNIDINLINSQDIIIGTDFLVKNYLYYIKNIDSIVLFSIDSYLNMPDFKSNEFMFRYIVNMINIANEKNIKDILIKTKYPDNDILNLGINDDYKNFYNKEIKTREILKYPPFSIIIKLIIKDRINKNFDNKLLNTKEILEDTKDIEIIGENSIKNKKEVHIIIKVKKENYEKTKDMLKKISKYALLDINPEFLIK